MYRRVPASPCQWLPRRCMYCSLFTHLGAVWPTCNSMRGSSPVFKAEELQTLEEKNEKASDFIRHFIVIVVMIVGDRRGWLVFCQPFMHPRYPCIYGIRPAGAAKSYGRKQPAVISIVWGSGGICHYVLYPWSAPS